MALLRAPRSLLLSPEQQRNACLSATVPLGQAPQQADPDFSSVLPENSAASRKGLLTWVSF